MNPETENTQQAEVTKPADRRVFLQGWVFKLLAGVVAAVILGFASFFIQAYGVFRSISNSKTESYQPSLTSSPAPSPDSVDAKPDANDKPVVCDREECLFENKQFGGVVGMTRISGFYKQSTEYADPNDPYGTNLKKYECNQLVITDGGKQGQEYFEDLAGLPVNKKPFYVGLDESGRVVINIDWSKLSRDEVSRIASSTESRGVELTILIPVNPASEADPCYSPIELIKAE